MSRHTQRVFFSDNGTLSDKSIALNDFRRDSFVMPFVSAEDYLYVGADWTFNNLHFDLSAVNALASSITVELWSGENNGWKAAASILDYTSVGSASLARNGHVTWDRDPDEAWVRESESKDITELSSGPDIRGFYWARFKWSADLTATTELNHLGFKFNDDNEIYSFYPELNNSRMKLQWESGKVDWNEQSFMAADILIRDLKKQNVIDFAGEVLDYELWKDAAIHKTAQIIFGGLGNARDEEMKAAAREYEAAKNLKQPGTDANQDARLDLGEKVKNVGFMTR